MRLRTADFRLIFIFCPLQVRLDFRLVSMPVAGLVLTPLVTGSAGFSLILILVPVPVPVLF